MLISLPRKRTNEDFPDITQRICEERQGDAIEFNISLSEVEEMTDDEDWSEVNGAIANMIRKYYEEMVNTK